MNILDNTGPYQINKVVAPWLNPAKDAAGIFIDFTINAGETVTHEFKKGEGDERDILIYNIQSHPNDVVGTVDYTHCLYQPTKNQRGLQIQLVAISIHGEKSLKQDVDIYYTLGGYSDEGKEYEIDYVTAPFASFKENRSVYIIVNMEMHEGDFVCGCNFELAGVDRPIDQFIVNVISSGDTDKPSVPYVGVFGPFATPNGSVELGTSVNGNVPISSPVGIKSYGNDTVKHLHQTA